MKIGMIIEVNLRKAKDGNMIREECKSESQKNNWTDYCQVLKKISIR
jgi:hypothetical protein